jgi:hypothetical protein
MKVKKSSRTTGIIVRCRTYVWGTRDLYKVGSGCRDAGGAVAQFAPASASREGVLYTGNVQKRGDGGCNAAQRALGQYWRDITIWCAVVDLCSSSVPGPLICTCQPDHLQTQLPRVHSRG